MPKDTLGLSHSGAPLPLTPRSPRLWQCLSSGCIQLEGKTNVPWNKGRFLCIAHKLHFLFWRLIHEWIYIFISPSTFMGEWLTQTRSEETWWMALPGFSPLLLLKVQRWVLFLPLILITMTWSESPVNEPFSSVQWSCWFISCPQVIPPSRHPLSSLWLTSYLGPFGCRYRLKREQEAASQRGSGSAQIP